MGVGTLTSETQYTYACANAHIQPAHRP